MHKRSAEQSANAAVRRWSSPSGALVLGLLVAGVLGWLLVRPSARRAYPAAHAEPLVLDAPASKR